MAKINSGRFKKGHIPWHKGTKGLAKLNSGSFKKGHKINLDKKHPKEWIEKTKCKKGHKESMETRRKKHESAPKGKKSHLWKGGITPRNMQIRRGIEFRLWREAIFARDNWTCQKCKIRGKILNSHHVQNFAQYPELRFAIDNGITLCEKCHRQFHKKYGKENNNFMQMKEFLTGG